MKTEREKHEDAEDRRFKKLALEAGFKGGQGGWIYRKGTTTKTFYANPGVDDSTESRSVETWTAVAQGWRHFERLFAGKLGFKRVPFRSV